MNDVPQNLVGPEEGLAMHALATELFSHLPKHHR
jgi:hypothetical protein